MNKSVSAWSKLFLFAISWFTTACSLTANLEELLSRLNPLVPVELSSTAVSPTNSNSISVSLEFAEEVTKISEVQILVEGASLSNLSGSGRNFTFDLNLNTEGEVLVRVPSQSVQFLSDKNKKQTADAILKFVIDSTAPTAVISSELVSPVSEQEFSIQIEFSEKIVGLEASDFVVSGTAGAVVTGIEGLGPVYTLNLVAAAIGNISIQLPAGAVRDLAGNLGQASNVYALDFMPQRPTATLASSITGVTNLSVLPITVNFSRPVTGLSEADFVIVNGSIADMSGSGSAYTLSLLPSADGVVEISLPADVVTDAFGLQNIVSNVLVFNSNRTAPSISIARSGALIGNSSTEFVWTVDYTGATVVSLSLTDITLSGTASAGCVPEMSGTGSLQRTITVTGCTGNGTLGLAIAASTARNDGMNYAVSATGANVTVDNIAPAMSVVPPSQLLGNSSTEFIWQFSFSDLHALNYQTMVVSLDTVGVTHCATKDVSLDNNIYEVKISGCTGDGTVKISFPAGVVQDTAGNNAAAFLSEAITIDNTPPTLSFLAPAEGAVVLDLANFNANGTCSENGKILTFVPAAKTAVECESGQWSAQFDLTAITEEDYAVSAELSDTVGNTRTVARTFLRSQYKVKKLFSTRHAFVALKSDGGIEAWGDPNYGGTAPVSLVRRNANVKNIYSGTNAIAALRADGTAEAWGISGWGGTIAPAAQSSTAMIKKIVGNDYALAALKADGRVISWGNAGVGGDAPSSVTGSSAKVKEIFATDSAFAALNADGTVSTWGSPYEGGSSDYRVIISSANIRTLSSTKTAFAALSVDGVVYAWGNEGGAAPSDLQLNGATVIEVFSNDHAFAALQVDGSVVTWGHPDKGGVAPSSVTDPNSRVKKVFGHKGIFVALKDDGSVVSWGDPVFGTPPTSVTNANSGVVSVVGTEGALAALKGNGTVVAWGQADTGGTTPWSLVGTGAGAVEIISNEKAFAALKFDGSVVAWGAGGFGSSAPMELTSAGAGVVQIVANSAAFSALTSSGAVYSWGFGSTMTNLTAARLSGTKASAKEILGNGTAMAAIKSDGKVVPWGHVSYGGSAPIAATGNTAKAKKLFYATDTLTALHADGIVTSWGNPSYGGTTPPDLSVSTAGVKSIHTNMNAYTALKHDGSVASWGFSTSGVNPPSQLTSSNAGVIDVKGTHGAFTALKSNGSVQAWGNVNAGGSPISAIQDELMAGVKSLTSSAFGFAALKANGSIVEWGSSGYAVRAPVSEGRSIVASDNSFAAIKYNGQVEVWGSLSSTAPASLKTDFAQVAQIFSNIRNSYAALSAKGQITTWGDASYGGVAPEEITLGPSGVVTVASGQYVMVALKSDGTIVGWGEPLYGGDVPEELTEAGANVIELVGAREAFAALKADGTVLAWGMGTSAEAPSSVKSPGSNVIKIIQNSGAFFALKSDGTVIGWGSGSGGGGVPNLKDP